MGAIMLFFAVRDAVGALFLGFVPVLVVWRLLPKYRKRTQRIVDFLSYTVTLAAVGTALFSLSRYEIRSRDHLNQMMLEYGNQKIYSDTLIDLWRICPVVVDDPPKADDCRRMDRYLRSWPPDGSLSFPPYPPEKNSFVDAEMQKFAERVDNQLRKNRDAIAAYNRVRSDAFMYYDPEAIFLRILVPTLALAFGLGIARRLLDIVTDWPVPTASTRT